MSENKETEDNVQNINSGKRSALPRILIVDDSEFSRQTIISILEAEGFNIVGQANSAETALQQAFNSQANVFLIDVVMPEVGGIELANLIRDNIKDPRIIMMSTLDVESVIIESVSTGAIDFITKPFNKEDLIKSIEKVEYDMEKEVASL